MVQITVAAIGVLCLMLIFASSLSKIEAATVRVTIPIQPVTVGGVLPIQCDIQDYENHHKMKMFRVINDQTEELTSDARYMSDVLGQRYFVTRKQMANRNMIYFMSIVDASVLDEGEYLCKVYTLTGGDYIKIAEGSIDAKLYFLPNIVYPQCTSTTSITRNMQENVPFDLKCISSIGSPAVNLQWINSLNQESIRSRDTTTDDTVTSEINLMTSLSLDGSVFICEMTSDGFSDVKRTCQIGPITIEKPVTQISTDIQNPIMPTQSDNNQVLITGPPCIEECPNNEYMIVYLSMATICASILCLVFLITTIIMCCKYQNKSDEIRNAERRHVTTCDGSEPVYVSLQARPDPGQLPAYFDRRPLYKETDRSTGYMSVEDPNNPGNKILMP